MEIISSSDIQEEFLEAAEDGDISTLKTIYENGIDVNAHSTEDGSTAVILACVNNDIETVKFLCERDANIYQEDHEFLNAFTTAITNSHMDIVKYLYLIEPNILHSTDSLYGETPLHCASSCGLPDMVRLLCDYGAVVNAIDRDRMTPLHVVADIETAKLLVEEYNALIDPKDKDEQTPAFKAASSGDISLLKYLYEKGADLRITDILDESVLYVAALNGQLDIVKFLVEEVGVYPEKNSSGLTPLHAASTCGSISVVRYLLEVLAVDPNK